MKNPFLRTTFKENKNCEKDKFVPMQAMKAYRGSGGTTSLLNLGARWW